MMGDAAPLKRLPPLFSEHGKGDSIRKVKTGTNSLAWSQKSLLVG